MRSTAGGWFSMQRMMCAFLRRIDLPISQKKQGVDDMLWKQFLTPVKNVDAKEAQSFIDKHVEGTYRLLDVRQPAEYEKSRIPGSKLIPVGELADRLGELDRRLPIIAY